MREHHNMDQCSRLCDSRHSQCTTSGSWGTVSESCRNGYNILMRYVSAWLPSMILIENWADMDDDELRSLYTCLGVDATWLDTYVHVQPRYHEGHFKVASHMQYDSHSAEIIMDLLMHTWLFRKFTSSRWLTLGEASNIVPEPSCWD